MSQTIEDQYWKCHLAAALPEEEPDQINPTHYKDSPLGETIEIIERLLTPEQFSGFLKGNVLKYRLRAGRKGHAATDIEKALWYEQRLEKFNNLPF